MCNFFICDIVLSESKRYFSEIITKVWQHDLGYLYYNEFFNMHQLKHVPILNRLQGENGCLYRNMLMSVEEKWSNMLMRKSNFVNNMIRFE